MKGLLLMLVPLSALWASGEDTIPVTHWVGPDSSQPGTYEEWIAQHPFSDSATLRLDTIAVNAELGVVGVYVDGEYFAQLDTEVASLRDNLHDEGYTVRVYSVAPEMRPDILRDSLRIHHDSLGVEGALFIGDIPTAWFQVQYDSFGDTTMGYTEYPIDLFYMDLDGEWYDSTRGSEYVWEPGTDSIYDIHRGEVAPEIYVGRIMPRDTGALRVDSGRVHVRRYLQKNNAFRHDTLRQPPAALHFADDDWARWTEWADSLAVAFPDTDCYFDSVMTSAATYDTVLPRPRTWVSVFAHSTTYGHTFYSPPNRTASWFIATKYTSLAPPASFYNYFACSFLRYTRPRYGGSYALYNSDALGCVGSTKTGSMLHFEDFYDPLAEVAPIGEAFLHWFDCIAQDGFTAFERSWFYGMTLLGDPFLRPVLQKDVTPVSIDCPSGSYDSIVTVVPEVTVRNQGRATETFRVALTLSLRGTACHWDTSEVESLAPFTTGVAEFDSVGLDSGTWRVSVRTLLEEDENRLNDTCWDTVVVAGPHPGWNAWTKVPSTPTSKPVAAGSWLTWSPADRRIYVAKGNRTTDFYAFDLAMDTWRPLPSLPTALPYRGCRGVSDGARYVYMTQGKSTLGFWRFSIEDSTWETMPSVPAGHSGKRVTGGADMVYVERNDSGYVYLLKGHCNEFYRFCVARDTWESLPHAPVGMCSRWDPGSWLVFTGGDVIYAHKARYNELWAFDLATDEWVYNDTLSGMPFVSGLTGSHKKSKDGAAAACIEGRIYALKGGNTREFWRYDPAADSWQELDTVPRQAPYGQRLRCVNQGGDIVAAEGRLFALKGNKTYEFWRYLPASGGQDFALFPFSLAPGRIAPQRDGEVPLADSLEAQAPRWSSDGQRVCYFRADDYGWNQCFVATRLGGAGTQVTSGETDFEYPVYSPDRKYLALQYFDTVSNRYQVAVVRDSSGYKMTVRTNSAYDHTLPEWSPSGETLVMEREDDEGYVQVAVVPADSGDELLVTNDQADHFEPSFLDKTTVVYTWSPSDDYDQIARVDISTLEQTVLTESKQDHEAACPGPDGQGICFQVLDDETWQIGTVSKWGGDEEILSKGTTDKEEPDWSDTAAIYCVNWLGLTSEIGWVDASSGEYTAVTDGDAIRDNPDTWRGDSTGTDNVVYERTVVGGGQARDGGKKKRPGNGIFMVRHAKKPKDGQMGMPIRILALNRAKPNPVAGRAKVHINWAVPKEELVSLKVYNTAGQVARVLHQGMTKPGQYTTIWDGTDAEGRRLAAGVYFYALATDERRLSRKVVLAAE